VTGNDPHLSLNTTAAEVTTDDSIDPDSSGFIVNQVAATNINVSSASYIFYAVASTHKEASTMGDYRHIETGEIKTQGTVAFTLQERLAASHLDCCHTGRPQAGACL
jgi:hypothetical protein